MSDASRPLPPKKDVALALLEREPSVFIHLDPRRPGVCVPKWFTGQPQLILQVGMNMQIPIPDLKVDDEGISCTLSFNRAPFWCQLPWHAIWALVSEDQRGMVWPDDIPPDLAAHRAQRSGAAAAPQKPAKRPRPRLAAVGPADAEAGEEREQGKPTPDEAARAGEASRPASPPLRAVAPAPQAEQPGEEAGGESEATPGGKGTGKPKRELPPYLRVIK